MELISKSDMKSVAKAKYDKAVDSVLKNTFMQGKTPVVLSSYGKDSTLVKMVATAALRKAFAMDLAVKPKLSVFTSLVGGFESPIMAAMVTKQVANLKAFAKKNNLSIEAHVISPSLSENFFLQMISGRSFGSFPGQDKTCSVSLKEAPMERLKKQIECDNFVSLFGNRRDESAERAKSMAERSESSSELNTDAKGRLSLSPIADFTEEEVFSIISDSMYFEMGLSSYECPVDPEMLMSQYNLGSETECSMKAFMSAGKDDNSVSGSCGSSGRFGCWGCLKVSNDNKHTQIAKEDGYGWLELFINIREALKATQFAWNKRSWLSKSVKNGMLKIEPASYSPQFCKDLLRWCLTAQEETGISIINDQELLWIALNWGRYGIASPAEALWIRLQIKEGGQRFYPTKEDMTAAPETKVPIGQWVDATDTEFGNLFAGKTDFWATVADVSQESSLKIDLPTAEELEDFFAFCSFDIAIENLNKAPSEAFHQIVRMTGAKLLDGDNERMLQRSNLIWRKGLMDKLHDQKALVEALIDVDDFQLMSS